MSKEEIIKEYALIVSGQSKLPREEQARVCAYYDILKEKGKLK